MNCRQCGQKLGLIGRVRNNPFCSKECKDAFEVEEARLTEQIVEELRSKARPFEKKETKKETKKERERPPREVEEPVIAAAADEAAGEAEGEFEAPDMLPFLDQEQPERVNWKAVQAAQSVAVPLRKTKIAWKDLAQQVEGRLSGSAMASAEIALLARAIPCETDNSGPYLVGPQRPVLAPEIRPPRLKGTLHLAGMLAPVTPEFRPPAFALPDVPPLLESSLPRAASLPARPVPPHPTRGLPLPGQLPAVPVPPPAINEAVPPGATWAEPHKAWDVQPQAVAWTDVAMEAIRLTVFLDPYDIHPSGGSPYRFSHRAPVSSHPVAQRPAMAPGPSAPAGPPPSAVAAPPSAYAAPHPSVQPSASAYSAPPASGAPASWVPPSFYPGARPVRRPQTNIGPLPSHMPVMSLADLFIPEFAPALLHWPWRQDCAALLHDESAVPTPPIGTRRPHFPMLRYQAASAEPAPGAPVDLSADPIVTLAQIRSSSPEVENAAPQEYLAHCPVRAHSLHNPNLDAATATVIPASPLSIGAEVRLSRLDCEPGRGQRLLPHLPLHEWAGGDPQPEPGQPVGIGAAPRSPHIQLKLGRPNPKIVPLAAQLPRRESFAWSRPGFQPRVLRPRVRVSALDAGVGEMVAPVTI